MPATAASAARATIYLIASLTTSPTRLRSLYYTLRSLDSEHQYRPFDDILLNLPDRFARTGQEFPAEVPEQVAHRVTVNRCGRDWGPATKLVPTVRWLLHERLPHITRVLGLPRGADAEAIARTHIVICDDDIVYPRGMAQALAAESASYRVSMGASGFNLVGRTLSNTQGILAARKHLDTIDVAEAFGGWRMPLEPFSRDLEGFEARFSALTANLDARISDDLLISDYLEYMGVPRFLHCTQLYCKHQLKIRPLGNEQDALHRTNTSGDAHWDRYWRVLASGMLKAVHMPKRWSADCPANLLPTVPPACHPVKPEITEPAAVDGAAADGAAADGAAAPAAAASAGAEPAAGALHYRIVGERHTGANALRRMMLLNFGTELMPGGEATQFMWTTDSAADLGAMRQQLQLAHSGAAPLVVLVREPLQWLLAMHRAPHDAPWLRLSKSRDFVSSEWLSPRVPQAAERCAQLGLVHNRTRALDEIRRLPAEQQRQCAVHAFKTIVELRIAKLGLMRDAFDLVRADEQARRGGLVHTVSRRQGGAQLVVLRYEDISRRPSAVACLLGSRLGLCPRSVWISLEALPVQPDGNLANDQDARDRLAAVTPDGCAFVFKFPREVWRALLEHFDWELEELFGYGGYEQYRTCARALGKAKKAKRRRSWRQQGTATPSTGGTTTV